jgi:predicted MFS family arabinose efflux permease
VLGLIALAAVLAVLWILVELGSETPLIDMRMMRISAVWTCNLVIFLLGFGLYASLGFVPQFVQTPPSAGYGFGASVTESGLLMLPSSIATFAAGVVAGRIVHRFTARRALIAGATTGILPWIILVFAHSQQWEILLAMTLMGLGYGLAWSVAPAIIVGAVPPAQTGVATGMNANIRVIGSAIGAAVMSTIVTSTAGADGYPSEAGYTAGFAMLALITAAAAIAGLLVPTQSPRPSATAPQEATPGLALAPAGPS